MELTSSPIESVEPSTVSMSLIYLFPRRSPDRALETQNVRNVRFYRKQGFRVVSEGEVPGHGLRVWTMLRGNREELMNDASLER